MMSDDEAGKVGQRVNYLILVGCSFVLFFYRPKHPSIMVVNKEFVFVFMFVELSLN